MGFSADWLALREPADLAARDADLLRRAVQAAGPNPLIVDLGCGTGATWRAMAQHLPKDARWRFVDNDPALLAHAASQAGIGAELVEADIADIDALPLDGATLVTASALLDLVSEAWLRALAARLQAPLYAALNYDGIMNWTPEDPRDAGITDAFNRHQRSDKGLGPALGPDAASCAAEVLGVAGFDVQQGQSPWRLGPDMADLQTALTSGIAQAARDAGAQDADLWGQMRRKAARETHCVIGHLDILALPKTAHNEVSYAVR